jgi:Zn-dependent protease with chaperone function
MTINGTGVSAETSAQNTTVLDERVVGAGTTLRFVLLLLLFTVGSFSMFSYVVENISGSIQKETECELAAGMDLGASPLAAAIHVTIAPANYAAYEACVARYAPAAGWLPLAAAGGLIVVAFGLYWLLPAWKVRRSRVMSLDEVDVSSRVRSVVDGLVATVGLADRPSRFLSFAVNPAAVMTTNAVVFGRRRRYTVCLDIGLLTECESERFRAVVLHELAHIVNGDVDVTYATVALWRVFLIAALCPDVAVSAYAMAMHDRWALSWGFDIGDSYGLAFLALIVLLNYLARADILRTREIYADLTSVRWGAGRESWSGGPAIPGPRGGGMRSRLRVLSASAMEPWRSHPARELRRQSLTDPRALFALSALPMFLTGAASDIATSELNDVLYSSPVAEQVDALFVAALAITIAGIALWRAVVYAVLTGRPVPSGLRAGLWLGAGIVTSEFLGAGNDGDHWLPPYPEAYLILIAAAVFALAWTGQTAELYVRAWPGRSLRPAMALGLTGSWLVFTYLMYLWYHAGNYLVTGWPFSVHGVLQVMFGVTGQPLAHPDFLLTTTATLILLPATDTSLSGLWWIPSVLWLIPLLAWTARRTAHRPEWHVRALPAPDCPPPAWDLPGLRRICCAGLLGGALACGGVAAAMALTHHIMRSGLYNSGAVDSMYPTAVELAICGAMVLTAAATVLLVKRHRLVAAFIAAGITALVGLGGQYALLNADGCLGPFDFLTTVCRLRPPGPWGLVQETSPYVLGFGVIAAGLVALGAVAWGGIIRSIGRRAEEPSRRTMPTRGIAVRRVTIGAVCALTIGFTVAFTAQSGLGLSGGSDNSTIPSDLFGNPATSSSSASLQRLQVAFWVSEGGGDLALDISGAWVKVIAVFIRKTITPQQLTAPCAALASTIPRAKAYFAVPNARGEQLWSQLLDGARSVDADCETYLKAPANANLNALGNAAVSNDYSSLIAFLKWFNQQPLTIKQLEPRLTAPVFSRPVSRAGGRGSGLSSVKRLSA